MGLTNRLTTRALDTETLKILRPENIGSIQILTSELLDTMDHSTKETKKKMKVVRELEEKQAIKTLEANILKLELNNIQAQDQLEKLRMNKMAQELAKDGVDPEIILKTTGVDVRPKPELPPNANVPPIPGQTQQAAAPEMAMA